MNVSKKRVYCLFFLIILFARSSFAQDYYDFEIKNNQLKKTAEHAVRKGDFYTAIAFYEHYCEKKNTHRKASLELAHLYLKTRDYSKALKQFDRAYEIDPVKNLEALFYKGRMLMATGHYSDAIETLNKFKKQARGKKRLHYNYRLVKVYLEGCEIAIRDTVPAVHLYLEHIENGVNRAYNEFSPVPYNDNKLIFASIKSDTVIHYDDSLYQKTSTHKNSFFLAEKVKDKWNYTSPFYGPFSFENYDVGNGAFSPDGTKLYFTKCAKNWKYKMICNIYSTQLSDTGWTEPVPLPDPINLKKYTSTQPTFGIDPKHGYEIIYFVSNRPGGRGGTDIWYSVFKKGEYTEPKNCGGRLNTPEDEVSPFYDRETNTLYFSSNGHPNHGELDIFKSSGQKNKWMKNPENLGLPFNSSADDLYYIFGEDPKEGFLTSNREGGIVLKNPTCCDDIYNFVYDEMRRYNYNAFVYSKDKEETSIITEGQIGVYLLDPESMDTTLIKIVQIPANGELNLPVQIDLDYVLIFDVPSHFSYKVRIPPDGTKRDYTETDNIYLQKITEDAIVLKNIYYDFDDSKLTNRAMTAIDSFLLEVLQLNPKIKVEISSHTDSKGSGDYNIRLSQKRAESVVNYLKNKGIPSQRMIARGYGKTKPIAPNENPDGSDNPEGRQINRRTEFRVIGYKYDLKSER